MGQIKITFPMASAWTPIRLMSWTRSLILWACNQHSDISAGNILVIIPYTVGERLPALKSDISYYTVILLGRITGFARPSVCPVGLLSPNPNTKRRRKTEIGVSVPHGSSNRCVNNFRSNSQRSGGQLHNMSPQCRHNIFSFDFKLVKTTMKTLIW